MTLDSQLTENLEARLAEELEERTEFCDWVSICYSCCGGGSSTSSCTQSASGPGTCSTTPTVCSHH